MSQSVKKMQRSSYLWLNKLIFNLLVLILCYTHTTAQSKFEVGFALNTMQYEGEIGGRFPFIYNDLHNPTSRPRIGGGINFGYHLTDFLSLRGVLNIGSVQAADRLLTPSADPSIVFKLARNLSFRSSIVEAGVSGEFYPLPIIFNRWGQNLGRFNPYLIGGFNVFRFNPKSLYIDPTGATYWVELKPLRTEGQGMNLPNAPSEYSLTSFSIPFGIGVRFNVNDYTSVALEWVNRRTFTDYLDDVSGRFIDRAAFDTYFGAGTVQADQAKQKSNFPTWLNGVHVNSFMPQDLRGSPNSNFDYYYSGSFKVFINLDRLVGTSTSWIGGDKSLTCPKIF
jgi:hypothetical protein